MIRTTLICAEYVGIINLYVSGTASKDLRFCLQKQFGDIYIKAPPIWKNLDDYFHVMAEIRIQYYYV